MVTIKSSRGARFTILFLLATCASGAGTGSVSLADRQADSKEFVQPSAENCAWPQRQVRPCRTWQQRYARVVDAADSKEALAGVIAAALDEPHDVHADVRSRNPNRWLPVPTFADIWAEPGGQVARVIAVRGGSDAQRAKVQPGAEATRVNGVALSAGIGARLTGATGDADARARCWALLSLLAGRADAARHLNIRDAKGRSRDVTLPLERHFEMKWG